MKRFSFVPFAIIVTLLSASLVVASPGESFGKKNPKSESKIRRVREKLSSLLNTWYAQKAVYHSVIAIPPLARKELASCAFIQFNTGTLTPSQCAFALYDLNGNRIDYQVLWCADGEPVKLLFDCSDGSSHYHLYILPKRYARMVHRWKPEAGLVLTIKPATDTFVENVAEFRKLWAAQESVQGKTVVDQVFNGANPFGPLKNFMARYAGSIHISTSGRYRFSTASDGASFLLVDGKMIAEWPGIHRAKVGLYGQHYGEVKLAKGTHSFEYLHVQNGGRAAAVAAWTPPGESNPKVIPASAFESKGLANGKVLEWVARDEKAGEVIEWSPQRQIILDRYAAVEAYFNIVAQSDLDPVWVFDDGTQVKGASCTHLFLRSGIQEVKLESHKDGHLKKTAVYKVNIQPQWNSKYGKSKKYFNDMVKSIRAVDLTHSSDQDLLYHFEWCIRLKDMELLLRSIGECVQRIGALYQMDPEIGNKLARAIPDDGVIRHGQQIEEFFQDLIASGTLDPLTLEKARLNLADLKINITGDFAAGTDVLSSVSIPVLDNAAKRKFRVLKADALLAAGDAKTARIEYTKLGKPRKKHLRSATATSVLRRARLDKARDLLIRKEYDAAEAVIEKMENETPAERMAPDVLLVKTRIFLDRKEPLRAKTQLNRMLSLELSDGYRSQVLYRLTEACLELNDKDGAQQTLNTLIEEYPYSEAAAQAKDRWK